MNSHELLVTLMCDALCIYPFMITMLFILALEVVLVLLLYAYWSLMLVTICLIHFTIVFAVFLDLEISRCKPRDLVIFLSFMCLSCTYVCGRRIKIVCNK